jgi:ferredoxin-NADP reductase
MDLTERKSIVKSKRHLTRDVVELVLERTENDGFTYQAGQYIQFLFDFTFRSYSMVNTPSSSPFSEGEKLQVQVPPLAEGRLGGVKELVFCIKLIPDGLASEYVANLQVGDEVIFRGPYGDFTAHQAQNMLCVATGVGVAPIRCIIEDRLYQSESVTLLFGVREEKDIFYHDVFFNLAKHHQNFLFIPMLSQPKGEWSGEVGRVTDYLRNNEEIAKNHQIFICGSQAMVIDVRDILLRQGAEEKNIKTEIFS